jgi:hypothetical protein
MDENNLAFAVPVIMLVPHGLGILAGSASLMLTMFLHFSRQIH